MSAKHHGIFFFAFFCCRIINISLHNPQNLTSVITEHQNATYWWLRWPSEPRTIERKAQSSTDTSLTDKHLVSSPLPGPSLSSSLSIRLQKANASVSRRREGEKCDPQICQDNCATDKSPMENPSKTSLLP